jgi:predicted MFS family arabinose efflux permease
VCIVERLQETKIRRRIRMSSLKVVLGGLLALVIATGVGRFAFTPILPRMGLDDRTAGLLASLNNLGCFAGALLVARVPGGRARTVVFRACLVLSLVTTVSMGLTERRAVWAAVRLLAGIASAGMLALGSAIVLQRLAACGRQALAGYSFGGVGLGIAGAGAMVALLDVSWQLDWLVLGGVCTVLAVPVWSWVTAAPAAQAQEIKPLGGAGRPGPALTLLTISYFCEGAGYIVTATFLVALLARAPETAPVADLAWILVGLAAMVSGPLWTRLGAGMGLRRALVLAFLVQAAAMGLPVVVQGGAAALVGAVGFGGTFMGITALALSLASTLAGRQSGAAIATLTAAFTLGQMLAPLPAGWLAERSGGFGPSLAAAASVVALGAALLLVPVGARATPPG